MLFQVGIGSLGGTVFCLVGFCTPLQTMSLSLALLPYMEHLLPKASKFLNSIWQSPPPVTDN